MQKKGCSICKSENPLCKNIPFEKNLLLIVYLYYKSREIESRLLLQVEGNRKLASIPITTVY